MFPVDGGEKPPWVAPDAYRPDVMKQLSVVQGLLEGASRIMLRRHLEPCVTSRW